MSVVLLETMNGTPERNNSQGYGSIEHCITTALGQPEHIIAYNTYQVKNYNNYELAGFSEEAKRKYRYVKHELFDIKVCCRFVQDDGF